MLINLAGPARNRTITLILNRIYYINNFRCSKHTHITFTSLLDSNDYYCEQIECSLHH